MASDEFEADPDSPVQAPSSTESPASAADSPADHSTNPSQVGMTVPGLPVAGIGQSAPNPPLEHLRQMAYPYGDPYFYGLLAAYGGPPVMYHQQMLGLQQSRRLLPSEMVEEEPVYVNAKQYNGIMRRRQSRAKAEMENRLIKSRKPYLHESRHQHAMKRKRGCGGRFLKVKQDENRKSHPEGKMEGQAFQGSSALNEKTEQAVAC